LGIAIRGVCIAEEDKLADRPERVEGLGMGLLTEYSPCSPSSADDCASLDAGIDTFIGE